MFALCTLLPPPLQPSLHLLRFVMSGDSEGRCFFWEWSHAQKVVRTIKAHEGVCIGCEWNPMETSKVATCGWDGQIKVSV